MPVRGLISGALAFAMTAGTALAQSTVTIEGLPSVQFAEAPLVTPANALSYYNGQPGALTSPSISTDPRDPRIQRLADSLDNDAWRIYEYVKNSIEITPQFGLEKGAFGAILDGYGNPFDQANLMVELLREAGHTASYQYGEIQFSGATLDDFSNWMGPTTARGACELLSGGGIPGIVNGSTATDCATYSNAAGSLTSVRMAHVWVIADLGNGERAYDPSFKRHVWSARSSLLHSNINYRSATGGTIETYNGIPAITGMNASSVSNLESQLTAATTTLLGLLQQPANMNQSLVEIAGGSRIDPASLFDPAQDTATGSLPYQATTTALWTGDIPTALRATLTVDFYLYAPTASATIVFDVADLAGRRLTISPISIGTGTARAILRLDEEIVSQAVYDQNCVGCSTAGYGLYIGLSVDHPFAASGGGFMDDSLLQPTSDLVPSVILHSWGDRGVGAELRNAGAYGSEGTVRRSRPGNLNIGVDANSCSTETSGTSTYLYRPEYTTTVTVVTPPPGGATFGSLPMTREITTHTDRLLLQQDAAIGAMISDCNLEFSDVSQTPFHSAQMRTKMQVAESYLARSEEYFRLVDGVAGGRHVTHHVLGLATSRADLGSDGSLREDQLLLSATTRAAFAPLNDGSESEHGYARVAASGTAALESAITMEATGATEANSTASMFAWYLNSPDVPPAGQGTGNTRPFLLINSANHGTATAALFNYVGPATSWSQTFAADGFDLIMPLSGRLGPSLDSMRFTDEYNATNSNHWRIMGSAYLAYRSAGSGVEEISAMTAPACGTERYLLLHSASCIELPMKGAGGVTFDAQINGPTADQDYLATQFDSWASSFSVDVSSGGMTFSPPVDIETGSGGYPYSLPFQRSYNSASRARSALGDGWSHNLESWIEIGSDVSASTSGTAQTSVATLVAIDAALALFQSGDNAVDMVRALLVENWLAESMVNNAATIHYGGGTERFYRMPGGSFVSSPGSLSTLTQTGTVLIDEEWGDYSEHTMESWSSIARQYHRAFDYHNLQFDLTTSEGVVETFRYGADATHASAILNSADGSAGKLIGSYNTFTRRQTTFPTGVELTFTYNNDALSQVSNNLGRVLNFTYIDTPPPDPNEPWENSPPGSSPHGPAVVLSRVTDENGRQVSYDVDQDFVGVKSRRLNDFTDARGRVFTYTYLIQSQWGGSLSGPTARRAEQVLLTEIRLPHAPTTPFFTFGYDEFGRLVTVTDADGDTTTYGVGEGARGMVRDPLGNEAWSYFDQDGRNIASVSPRGILSTSDFDGIGRTLESRISEVAWSPSRYEARSSQAYDQYNNVISQIAHPQTDSNGVPLTDPAITSTTQYNQTGRPTWPTRQIDAAGQATVTCYSTATNEPECAGLPAGSLDNNDRGGLPRAVLGPEGELTLLDYDALGRPTRTRTLVSE
jgi:YD repeat-containing protein